LQDTWLSEASSDAAASSKKASLNDDPSLSVRPPPSTWVSPSPAPASVGFPLAGPGRSPMPINALHARGGKASAPSAKRALQRIFHHEATNRTHSQRDGLACAIGYRANARARFEYAPGRKRKAI
jgi:hypothetical protein